MSENQIYEHYESIKNDIAAFVEDFRTDENISRMVDKHYKGIQVLFSPLIYKPKVMFIGINPGAGFNNENNKVVKRYSPLENNEYYHYDYRLAQQTQKLFELSGLGKEELKSTVKTNCFFFATKNQKELYKMLSHLKSKDVYSKSAKWTDDLVSLVKPKIIICEGKSAFERFLENKDHSSMDCGNVLYSDIKGAKVIGYRRNFSNISYIEEVATVLKDSLKR
jgi:hypothetical protein